MDVADKMCVISDFGIRVGPDSFYTASSVPACNVLDLDRTLTSEDSSTVYEEFNSWLCSLNPKLDHNSPVLKKIINDIDNSPADFSEPLKSYNNLLRKCGLTKRQWDEASIRTGESGNIKAAPYAFDALLEQYKMNFKLGINTGSPKEPAVQVSKKKIGVKEPRIAGSEAEFDQDGYFISLWANLGSNKVKSMSNFFMEPENCYCDCAFKEGAGEIYVTDDLSKFEEPLVVKVGLDLGVVLYVGEDQRLLEIYKRPGEFVIPAPEIRKDVRKINPYINLYRRAKIFVRIHESPKVAKMISDTAKEIKKGRFCSDSKCFEEFSGKISQFVSIEQLFPRITTRFDEKHTKLKRAISEGDIDAMSKCSNELISILEDNEPFFHVKQEKESELDEIIQLLP